MSPPHRSEVEADLATELPHRTILLNDRYAVDELIGQGRLTEVHVGIDQRLGRRVAIKTLRGDLAQDPTSQARFRREAQSAASLNHRSIVAVYDTGEETLSGIAVPFIVMEYVEGQTLLDLLRGGNVFGVEHALAIITDILDALEYGHRADVLHRDIKAANVTLTADGSVKVMDFGITEPTVDDTWAMLTETATGAVTAQNLSPEQARGAPVDARSDIYSTGSLLYELLTGRPPFTGATPMSVANHHLRERPAPPSTHRSEVSAAVDALTLKALEKSPLDRYQSAAEMRDDIGAVLARQADSGVPFDVRVPVAPPRDPDFGETQRIGTWAASLDGESHQPDRRRTLMYVIPAVGALVLLVAGTVLGLRSFDTGSTNMLVAPSMRGMTQPEARSALARKGLQLGDVEESASESVPRGRVTSQNPLAGTTVEKGSTVDLTVSSGKPQVAIPDVLGSPRDEAANLLTARGLKVEEREDPSSTKAKGTVTRVSPAEGSMVSSGSTVTISYSSGLLPVPKVIGQSEDEAGARLNDMGFHVRTIERTTREADPGTVIGQTPDPGTRHKRGSTVTITVSRQPEPEPTPTPTETQAPGHGAPGPDDPGPSETPAPTPVPTPTPEPTPTETGPLPFPFLTGGERPAGLLGLLSKVAGIL